MGVELTGDWNKFNELKDMDKHIKKHIGNALEISGEVVRAKIVKGISRQSFDFVALADSTIERKRKLGKSPLTLVENSDYVSSFAVDRIKWDEVLVGTTMPQGRALEFGFASRNLPARPHVGPALEDSKEEIMKRMYAGVEKIFSK